MPWKVKITGPRPGDFEFVWEDTPTELPPVNLPIWEGPPLPRVSAGPDDIPPGDTPDAPAAGGETSAPSFDPADKYIDRIFRPPPRESETLPSPADIPQPPPRPPVAPVPPEPVPPPQIQPPVQPAPQPPIPQQSFAPDAIDNLFPEPTPQNIIGDQPLRTVQLTPPSNAVPNMQPLRQAQAAVLSGPARMTYELPSMVARVADLPGLAARNITAAARGRPQPTTPTDIGSTANFLQELSDSAQRQTRSWTGATEVPQDVGSRVGRNLGEAVSLPVGKLGSVGDFLKSIAIISGVHSAADETRHAVGNKSLADFAAPPDWLSGALVSPANAAPLAFERPPTGNAMVETIGGPKKVSNNELYAVGSIVLATAGMVFGPRIYQRFRSGDLPHMRPVTEAPRGTVAISKPGDLARTYDDANAGAMRLLRRTGIDPVAAREVENTMRLQTRATANAMADSAINAGRMETPAFTLQTRVPLAQLAPLESQPVRDYLHIMDTLDDLRQRSIQLLNNRATRGQMPFVRGEDLVSAGATRRALEAAHPEVVQIAREYWDIHRNLRNFEAAGEYATVTRTQNAWLKRQRQHEVPMHPRSIGDPNSAQPRGSAVEAMADDMRNRIRARLENEAKGKYIDEATRVMPNLFRPVTTEQLADNPAWRKNVVEIFRRGNRERYVTDPFLADVLRMDPYYITSNAGNLLYMSKRILEVSTTGELAPWFAITSALRSWQIGKFTAEEGMRSPTLIGTTLAIPHQLIPQLANQIAQRLDNGSMGWLSSVFGQANIQAMSTRMANAYANSLYARLQTVGGGRGSILQQQTNANNRITAAMQSVQGPARQFLETYRALLNSVHNAAAFDYARRNQGRVSLPELGRRARHLTGDPRIGGEYYTTLPGAKGGHATPIRFVNEQSRVSHTMGRVARVYGGITELGRTSAPWYNATVQGAKRIGEAYLDNPSKFTARAWLYYIAPTASLYLGVKSLGNDPNGRSYIDYMMNGRTEYAKTMNWYIPIPGRPAEEGIEFPAFHELTIAKRATDVGMDHLLGDSPFTESEDMRKAAMSVADVLWPAMPPVLNIAASMGGFVLPSGPFGGEAYKKQSDPFDQTGGMPGGIELFVRSIAAGIGDIAGTGYAAASQTPEGFFHKLWNGARAIGRRLAEKTPVVRNILGTTPVATGNTPVMEELFSKKKEIEQLQNYFSRWTDRGGLIGRDKPRSGSGEEAAMKLVGPKPPRTPAGIRQPEPSNPLYIEFMQEIHNRFVRDALTDSRGTSDRGGIGFLSMWDRLSMYNTHIRELRRVNEGNNVTWQKQIQADPEQMKFLKDSNVNPGDIKAVRNFYEKKRQDVARVLLYTIRTVEQDMSRRLGKKITLKDIQPYQAGSVEGAAAVDDTLDVPVQ